MSSWRENIIRMQGRLLLVWVLLNVGCFWRLDAHEDRDEDVDDALFKHAEIRPLRMLKERRGLGKEQQFGFLIYLAIFFLISK